MAHSNMLQFDNPDVRTAFYASLKRRGLQHCPKCATAKKQVEFHSSAWGNNGMYCRNCKSLKNREIYLETTRSYLPAKHREKTYGVDDETYRAIWQCQDGKCAVCDTDFRGLDPKHIHVDHDHRIGMIRGILCRDCNIGLGCFLDDPVRMSKAIKYLEDRIAVAALPKAAGV